jgi:sugar PTS system EIIA component
MFKKLFGKKENVKSLQLVSPVTGKSVPLESVQDPVFAEKMMGDGMAFDPSEGKVVSPVEGEIIQVFPTKHAIGIRAINGAEILIHIGLETVSMKGEGFTSHVEQGNSVKPGDTLVTFDLDLIREKAKSTVTPVIITNGDSVKSLRKLTGGTVEHGTTPIMDLDMN